MSVFEALASIFGFCVLAVGVAAVGQWLRDGLERAFGSQMQRQFPRSTDDGR